VRFDAGANLSHSEFRRAGSWDASASIAGRTPNTNAVLSMSTPHMSETLLFTTALADASVSAIEAYLAAKAPLPAPTVTAVSPRGDGFDLDLVPGHGAEMLGAGRYQVSLDGGTTWNERAEGFADSPLRVSGLAPGANVTVSVRAVNAAGYGTPSTPVIVAVPVPPAVVLPPPAQPATTLPATTTTAAPAPGSVPLPEPGSVTPSAPLSADMLAALPEGVVAGGVVTVQPGQAVTLQGGGFVPGEVVQAVIASEIRVLNTTRADAAGDVSMTATVPADLPAGQHTLALYAPVSGRGVRQAVTVTLPPIEGTETSADALPATGTRGTIVVLGWVLLAAGVIVGISRQRAVNRPQR
jgi:hypothetical protein